MKSDIQGRDDIILIVDQFYNKVKQDDSIGFFFNELIQVNWDEHLNTMYDFWENVLFFRGKYEGNPMQVHRNIHKMSPLNMQHFMRWNQLFSETVNEFFEGENAELIKQRAQNISAVIQNKLFG